MPEQFAFRDLRDLLVKANEEKSGGRLAGPAARSERKRVAAKRKLSDISLGEIVLHPGGAQPFRRNDLEGAAPSLRRGCGFSARGADAMGARVRRQFTRYFAAKTAPGVAPGGGEV